MAIPKLSLLLFPIFLTLIPVRVNAQVEETSGLKIITDWPTGMSMYGDLEESNGEFFDEDIDDGEMGTERRSLFWRRVHYYISYGALSANRIPCPPSGYLYVKVELGFVGFFFDVGLISEDFVLLYEF
eukprot:XP_025013918.1 protein RALF-like 34 [Ricinus communis]